MDWLDFWIGIFGLNWIFFGLNWIFLDWLDLDLFDWNFWIELDFLDQNFWIELDFLDTLILDFSD